MRAGGAAGRARIAENLAAHQVLADINDTLAHVRVQSLRFLLLC